MRPAGIALNNQLFPRAAEKTEQAKFRPIFRHRVADIEFIQNLTVLFDRDRPCIRARFCGPSNDMPLIKHPVAPGENVGEALGRGRRIGANEGRTKN
jgi:hypothetical protein